MTKSSRKQSAVADNNRTGWVLSYQGVCNFVLSERLNSTIRPTSENKRVPVLAMESGEHMRLNYSRNNSGVAELFPYNLDYRPYLLVVQRTRSCAL